MISRRGKRENTSRVWSAGRKLIGMTQTRMSKQLKISQGAISKYETGFLLPGLDEWVCFCELVGIGFHYSYVTGYIDKEVNLDYVNGLFKNSEKYANDAFVPVRELLPVIDFIHRNVDFAEWKRFCKNKVDPYYLCVLNAPLPIKLASEILQWTKSYAQKKDLNELVFDKGEFVRIDRLLRKSFREDRPSNALRSLVTGLARDNQDIFSYHFEEQNNNYRISLKINENSVAQRSEIPHLKSYLEYRFEYLSRTPLHLDLPITLTDRSYDQKEDRYFINFSKLA